jgi:hypothetical protein
MEFPAYLTCDEFQAVLAQLSPEAEQVARFIDMQLAVGNVRVDQLDKMLDCAPDSISPQAIVEVRTIVGAFVAHEAYHANRAAIDDSYGE